MTLAEDLVAEYRSSLGAHRGSDPIALSFRSMVGVSYSPAPRLLPSLTGSHGVLAGSLQSSSRPRTAPTVRKMVIVKPNRAGSATAARPPSPRRPPPPRSAPAGPTVRHAARRFNRPIERPTRPASGLVRFSPAVSCSLPSERFDLPFARRSSLEGVGSIAAAAVDASAATVIDAEEEAARVQLVVRWESGYSSYLERHHEALASLAHLAEGVPVDAEWERAVVALLEAEANARRVIYGACGWFSRTAALVGWEIEDRLGVEEEEEEERGGVPGGDAGAYVEPIESAQRTVIEAEEAAAAKPIAELTALWVKSAAAAAALGATVAVRAFNVRRLNLLVVEEGVRQRVEVEADCVLSSIRLATLISCASVVDQIEERSARRDVELDETFERACLYRVVLRAMEAVGLVLETNRALRIAYMQASTQVVWSEGAGRRRIAEDEARWWAPLQRSFVISLQRADIFDEMSARLAALQPKLMAVRHACAITIQCAWRNRTAWRERRYRHAEVARISATQALESGLELAATIVQLHTWTAVAMRRSTQRRLRARLGAERERIRSLVAEANALAAAISGKEEVVCDALLLPSAAVG